MRVVVSLLVTSASLAVAQMPGVPVLQNAWATPGLAAAADFSGGAGASVWAVAFSWSPGATQISGGGGMQSRTGLSSRGVYGVRVALPLAQFMNGNAGLSGFAGIGGGAATALDSSAVTSLIPVGVALGYRHAMGARGISIYASPSYQWASTRAGSTSGVRVGLGVDLGLAPSFGLTGGLQFGQARTSGGSGTSYVLGASYALGRR